MAEPRNDDQRKILDDTQSRIRLVQAAPGSGKTWLIGEIIRRELANWTSRTGGICALSFTNVAGDEIRTAVKHRLGHPHFVDTLDAFLFRYIIRPFSKSLTRLPQLRLVAGDAANVLSNKQIWHEGDLSVKVPGKDHFINVFQADYVGLDGTKPILRAKMNPKQASVILPQDLSDEIHKRKMTIWTKSGRISHSDAAFISSTLVDRAAKVSPSVLDLLSSRFPFIIVDELQDTGIFRSRIIDRILRHGKVRAVLVGDPDQAIYEFNGATPEVFDFFKKIPDTKVYDILETGRCPEKICDVANLLSATSRCITPDSEKDILGDALIACHSNDTDAAVLAAELRKQYPYGKVCVVTRRNEHVDRILGRATAPEPVLGSLFYKQVLRATKNFERAKMTSALQAGGAALGRIVLSNESPEPLELRAAGISEVAWKTAVVDLVVHSATAGDSNETYYDWGMRVRSRLLSILSTSGWDKQAEKSALPKKPYDTSETRVARRKAAAEETSEFEGITVQTVHGVKGETHTVTVLFVPKTSEKKCPSLVWWSDDEHDLEERRVAYVAATRPTDVFLLCVHPTTLQRLQEKRREFVAKFTVM